MATFAVIYFGIVLFVPEPTNSIPFLTVATIVGLIMTAPRRGVQRRMPRDCSGDVDAAMHAFDTHLTNDGISAAAMVKTTAFSSRTPANMTTHPLARVSGRNQPSSHVLGHMLPKETLPTVLRRKAGSACGVARARAVPGAVTPLHARGKARRAGVLRYVRREHCVGQASRLDPETEKRGGVRCFR